MKVEVEVGVHDIRSRFTPRSSVRETNNNKKIVANLKYLIFETDIKTKIKYNV